MSMVLYLVKVPPAVGWRIQADPDLLLQVWGETSITDAEVSALDQENDRLMEDYLQLGRVLDEQPDRFRWMRQAAQGTGDTVDFEYGYGPGFLIPPDQAGQIAVGLVEEGWWRPGDEVVTIDQAIAAFYVAAAIQERSVIGGIG